MQERKTPRDPKKSLWASYFVIFLAVLLFNWLLMPVFSRAAVQKVDYGTFLQMLDDGELSWLNDYLALVFEKLSKHLDNDPELLAYLKRQCAPFVR